MRLILISKECLLDKFGFSVASLLVSKILLSVVEASLTA